MYLQQKHEARICIVPTNTAPHTTVKTSQHHPTFVWFDATSPNLPEDLTGTSPSDIARGNRFASQTGLAEALPAIILNGRVSWIQDFTNVDHLLNLSFPGCERV